MAAESNPGSFSKLSELEEAIRISDINNVILRTDNFVILNISRYIIDPLFIKQTGLESDHASDAYDITLADTDYKRKVILSNKLNSLIQKNELQVGASVCLNKCHIRYDEADLEAESIIIVADLKVTGFKDPDDFCDSYDLPWYPASNIRQTINVPLASGRGCYVNVWTSADVVIPDELQPTAGQAPNGVENQADLDLCCIKELSTRWGRIQGMKPPILVRVVRKSRLINYAKSDKIEKWPFQQHFLVCDKSGYCTLVLWNLLCLKYIKQIKEGTVMMLRNFTVKKSFNVNYQWHLNEKDLDIYPIDINLNAHHPVAEISLLTNRNLRRQLRLAELKHRFVTRNQLSSLPDNLICDVAGIVVYVGRVEREAARNKNQGDSGGFWLSRWIRVRDPTHDRPFIIQLYKGQDPVFDTLKPYQVVMCRHVRVQHNLQSLNDSRQNRHVYLTTTALSHCVTLQQPLSPTVRAWMINVSRRLTDPEIPLDMSVGGYFSYPPLPHDVDDFREQHPHITITPCSGWREILDTLSFRQRLRLFVQAKLTALKFHGVEKRLVPGRAKKKTKVEPFEVVVNTNTHQNITHFDSISSHETTDCHLTPVEFSRGDKLNWLNLPSTEEPKPTNNGPTFNETEDILVMTWQGLNSHVLIHTMKPLSGVVLPRRPEFVDFAAGEYDIGNDENDSKISVQNLRDLLQSARGYDSDRFLLVLDVFRDSESHVDVVLNRGYLL